MRERRGGGDLCTAPVERQRKGEEAVATRYRTQRLTVVRTELGCPIFSSPNLVSVVSDSRPLVLRVMIDVEWACVTALLIAERVFPFLSFPSLAFFFFSLHSTPPDSPRGSTDRRRRSVSPSARSKRTPSTRRYFERIRSRSEIEIWSRSNVACWRRGRADGWSDGVMGSTDLAAVGICGWRGSTQD